MARLRYSRAEAEAEATRRAEAFVADLPYRDRFQYGRAMPDMWAKRSKASKHPMAWTVMFIPIPPEGGTIDGGEFFVDVDLESGTIGIREF